MESLASPPTPSRRSRQANPNPAEETMRELWTYLASTMGVLAFFNSSLHSALPLLNATSRLFLRLSGRLRSYCFYDITEDDDGYGHNILYSSVHLYLSSIAKSADSSFATHLTIHSTPDSTSFTFGLSENSDNLTDTFSGATATWNHVVTDSSSDTNKKRSFTLRIDKKDKPLLLPAYLNHIVACADDIRRRNKERLLYTSHSTSWISVPFTHPSTFNTLAMDPDKKAEIIADLRSFADGGAFYHQTGRAWKRGYLLYGPPGTGKSSIIAAMANFLDYDVFDLELTHVHSNADLRTLLMRTSSKSIIVIEDIDCSVTFQKRSKNVADDGGASGWKKDSITLSGLLNFTDGLWSCCGSQRIFVFTTNHIENIDPALLRPGRMDLHVHMGYCSFPALKILLKNYLGLVEDDDDGEWDHGMMKEVEEVIDDAEITPADVSEVLIKNRRNEKRKAVEELQEVLRSRAKLKKKKNEEAVISCL